MSLHLEPDLPQLEARLEAELDPNRWPPPREPVPVMRVTAVLVAHDGAAFLPRTLDAVYGQTRRPDALVGVDVGSVDHSGDLLAIATPHLLRLGRDTGFGDAVQAALIALDGTGLFASPEPRPAFVPSTPSSEAPPVDWLWLLHDDCAPAPDALERLVEAVDGGPSIGIAGCKQVSWDDARRLLEVGFTTSRLGARVTGIDVDDVDQGQLDHRSDVLAVGTAGMLIRRDVWDRLGGPDPALAHARDDLDLCRRAHLAGVRVVVVPRAVVAHAAATATGRRSSAGATWARRDRQAAVHLRLAATPFLLLPFLVAWLAAAALARAAGRLALKQPERAADELAAFGLATVRPLAWFRARRRLRRARRLPWRDYRRLLAGLRGTVRQRRDALAAYLRRQDEAWAASTGVPAIESSDSADPADSDGSAELDERPTGARVRLGLAAAAAVLGLVGLRLLLRGTGVPVGPALVPAPGSAGDLWAAARSGWRATGLGERAVADPFDLVLAALAWPLGGSTRIATEALLLGALPAAALLAWWAAGALTRSRALRGWAALGWCVAPSLLVSVATGRIAAIVAHLALPVAARALATVLTPPRRRQDSRRGSIPAASGLGLLIALAVAAAPSLALPAAVVLALAAALAGRGRGLLGWAAVVPIGLLLPWWPAVVRAPRLLLADPFPASGLPSGSASGWPTALWPVDPFAFSAAGPVGRAAGALAGATSLGSARTWIAGLTVALAVPVVVVALAALTGGPLRRSLPLWAAGLAGLVVAVLSTGSLSGGTGFAGPGVSLLLLALLAAALTRLDGAAGRLRARGIGWRHGVAVAGGLAAVLAPVTGAAAWAVDGWSAPAGRWVHRASPDVVPAVAAAEAEGPAGTRTLVLRPGPDALRWELYRSGGPRLGAGSAAASVRRASGPADAALLAVVGGLVSDTGTDLRPALSDLDIGSVFLLDGAGRAGEEVAPALDSAPGLVRVTSAGGGVLWRVELSGSGRAATRPARVQVLGADGRRLATLPSRGVSVHTRLATGPAGRTLVLSERADDGWRAWLDGERLTPVRHAGWAQAFRLPASGGRLTVEHVQTGAGAIDTARTVLLVVALLLAVPLPGRRRRLLPPPARRAQRSEVDLRVLDARLPTPRPPAHLELRPPTADVAPGTSSPSGTSSGGDA